MRYRRKCVQCGHVSDFEDSGFGDKWQCGQCGWIYPMERGADTTVSNPKASDDQIGGAHYKDMVIQPSEFIHKNNIPWNEGNVIKYVCRHKSKNGAEDIKKAIHYLQLILEWDYKQ